MLARIPSGWHLLILFLCWLSLNDCRQREIQNHGNHLEYGNSFTFSTGDFKTHDSQRILCVPGKIGACLMAKYGNQSINQIKTHSWRLFYCLKPNSSLLFIKPRSGALRSSSRCATGNHHKCCNIFIITPRFAISVSHMIVIISLITSSNYYRQWDAYREKKNN